VLHPDYRNLEKRSEKYDEILAAYKKEENHDCR
jgi:hypothetical protein